MSNKDLLTTEEAEHAKHLGWLPSWVYDLVTQKWLVKLFSPHDTTPPDAVAALVMGHARAGDKVAIKSLRLLMGKP